MLEHDLIELFDHQASEDQPPPGTSIATATRDGRTRRRRRRAVNIGAPLLAVITVLAVALSGTLLAPPPVPQPPVRASRMLSPGSTSGPAGCRAAWP